jgi:hypothetical protein
MRVWPHHSVRFNKLNVIWLNVWNEQTKTIASKYRERESERENSEIKCNQLNPATLLTRTVQL